MHSSSAHPFRNPALQTSERAADLIARLTLQEKIEQLNSGTPSIERLGIPALKWGTECLHGVARSGAATVFPQALGLAATFDPDLLQRVAAAIADETRAKFNLMQKEGRTGIGLVAWSPTINIFRDPRWGRGQETYGEDPFLMARMGVAFVKGLAGDDPHYLKVGSAIKHFAGHSGPDAVSTPRSAKRTCGKPICRPSNPASGREAPWRSWAPTTV